MDTTHEQICRFTHALAMLWLSVVLVFGCMPSLAWAKDNDAAQGDDVASALTPGDSTSDEGGDSGSTEAGETDGGGSDGQDSSGGGNDGSHNTSGNPSSSEASIKVQELFLSWEQADGDNVFVGPDLDIEQIQVEKKGQLVQLNGWYIDNTGSGVMMQTSGASPGDQLGAIPLTYESSDLSIATVGPSGEVTPKANGTVQITVSVAQPEKYGEASVRVTIVFDGQEGEYVSEVRIIDAEGNSLDENVVIENPEDTVQYYQLYAQVFWVDADGNQIRVEDTRNGDVTADLKWSLAGNTHVLNVNEDTGRVSTAHSGMGRVVVTVAGGIGGQSLTDTVGFKVTTGQDYEFNPAESLTIEVVYQDYPDDLVSSVTYSAEELESLLPQYTHFYTVVGGQDGSSYCTILARGYLFKDVLALSGVKLDDIYLLSFGTADSYQESVGYKYLFGTQRYYWPNFDIGSYAEGEVVPPMLATASDLQWNTSVINPNEELDEATRFRLVFGSSSKTDKATSKQIYYIGSIRIVLEGSPSKPDKPGKPDNPPGGDPQSDGDGGSNGNGNGSGNGNGNGGVGAAGPGGTAGDGSGSAGQGSNMGSSNGGDTDGEGGSGDTGGSAGSNGGNWRIYQMMSKAKSNPGELDLDNPLAPYALPAACIVFVAGGTQAFISYRRRLFA